MQCINSRKKGCYEKYVKRILDILFCILFLVCFGWVYIVVAIFVRVKLGSPVLFRQIRPGLADKDGHETFFYIYKFRTMTNERNAEGNLLPDELRVTRPGAFLRATFLDEIPEIFNILNGTMSFIGPRPQLVQDMVFMTPELRRRHAAKPGLSGLAQVNGLNSISWDEKLNWDLKYIENITFGYDLKLFFRTIGTVFKGFKHIKDKDESLHSEDYGDFLLREGRVSKEEYEALHTEARKLLDQIEND